MGLRPPACVDALQVLVVVVRKQNEDRHSQFEFT